MMSSKKILIKSYEELNSLKTYNERFNYLKVDGSIGEDTFGFNRYINQSFYISKEWKRVRNLVIIRDNGNDLGLDGYPIGKTIIVHHINPITLEDLENCNDNVLDPNNLICCSKDTHNAIHYGDITYCDKNIEIERSPNDMCPWREKE